MKPLLKPSSHSNLYYATMRSASFGLPSRNQITRADLRERARAGKPRGKDLRMVGALRSGVAAC